MESSHKRPHVLFIITNGENQKEFYRMQGSLEATGLATQDTFEYDSFFKKNNYSGDVELIHQCLSRRPDLIVTRNNMPDPFALKGYLWRGPSESTVSILRHRLGIPFASIWSDSDAENLPLIEHSLREGGKQFVVFLWDRAETYATSPFFHDRIVPLWSPYDTRLFNDPNHARDTDVSFVGSTHGAYEYRVQMLEALRGADIPVFAVSGGTLPLRDYIETSQRSKIVINFSKSFYGYTHLKARVLEAMFCGAMLLEERCKQSSDLFIEGKEFAAFSDTDELISKARYYLLHEAERQAIARTGQKTAHEKYGPTQFWQVVFQKTGITL